MLADPGVFFLSDEEVHGLELRHPCGSASRPTLTKSRDEAELTSDLSALFVLSVFDPDDHFLFEAGRAHEDQ